MITDSLPALALGIDVEENKSYMDRPPRHKNESLFANGGWSCTCFYGVLIGGISLLSFLQLPAAMLLANGEALTLEGVRRLLLDPQLESLSNLCVYCPWYGAAFSCSGYARCGDIPILHQSSGK